MQKGKPRKKSERLTPKERQALALVAGLFLIGFIVRWFRLAHLR